LARLGQSAAGDLPGAIKFIGRQIDWNGAACKHGQIVQAKLGDVRMRLAEVVFNGF